MTNATANPTATSTTSVCTTCCGAWNVGKTEELFAYDVGGKFIFAISVL